MALTPRGRALRWESRHRGITEQPAGSNTDRRKDGIRAAELRLGSWLVGVYWCGIWFANALLAAGVRGVTYRLASVANIEDDAKAERGPFRGWLSGPPTKADWQHRVFRGDGVVLFGRGIHVGLLRDLVFDRHGHLLYAVTGEGNTSSGHAGSQDNGGGAFRRIRYPHEIHGIALVDYPNR